MEIGLDFGLFELIAAAGLAWTARFVFKRRWLTIAFLVWSVAAPIPLLFLSAGPTSSEKFMKQTRLSVPNARERCASSASLTSPTSFKKSLSTWVYGRSPRPRLHEILR